MRKGPLAVLLAVALMTGVLSATPVKAQEEEAQEPAAPFACVQSFTDPGGDVDAANLDFTGGGIAAVDDSSFTVQMQVTNLSTEMPTADRTGLVWYFLWTYGDVTYFANAAYSFWTDETTYNLGTLDGTSFSTTAQTEGTFTEGENGTITVVVHLEEVGSPAAGEALTQVYSDSRTRLGGPAGPGFVFPEDRGPDGEGFGEDYTIGTCPAADSQVSEDDEPKKNCKKIENKKKRKKCQQQQRQQQ